MVDHLTDLTNPAVSAHQHRFEVQESWSNRIVVLSVSDEVDMLSAPQFGGGAAGGGCDVGAIRDRRRRGRNEQTDKATRN
jgi:hypothetical protein